MEKSENKPLENCENYAMGVGTSKIDKDMIDTIIISVEEYRELLTYKGRYEELKDICNNKLTSPILRPDAIPTHNHSWPAGVRALDHNTGHSCGYEAPRHAQGMEESNENHIPGV